MFDLSALLDSSVIRMECVQWPPQTSLCLLSASQLVVPRHQEFVLMTPLSNREVLCSLGKLRYTVVRHFLKVTGGSLSYVRVKLWLHHGQDFSWTSPRLVRDSVKCWTAEQSSEQPCSSCKVRIFSWLNQKYWKKQCPSCLYTPAAVSVPF